MIDDNLISSVLGQVSDKNIGTWIEKLASFHTRHTKSKIINDVADWLQNELRRLGYTEVSFYEYIKETYRLRNVICHKDGNSKRLVIVCAHYDCIAGESDDTYTAAPGANDNASGVSVILEIARIVFNIDLEDSIQFVFFSGEEQGFWGSESYARYANENDVNLYRLINLDMVGNPPQQQKKVIIEIDAGNAVSTNDESSLSYGKVMEQIAINYTDLQPVIDRMYNSDYMPFEALGYVVAGLYDGGEINHTHHSKADTPATVDMTYAASVCKIVLGTVLIGQKSILSGQ
jgi:Zn-dependent M28 family amino/carboxypeptidase